MKDGYCATPELRLAIKRGGYTVRQVAEILGYSKSHLYSVIRGDVPIRRIAAERIAEHLRVEFGVLWTMVGSGED